MVPADLKDFLVATVTASASFIGLLFVAMSFITDKSDKNQKQITTENILAESSYIALLDIFFVSLVALIPNTTIGYVTIIMAVLGISNSAQLLRAGRRDGVSRGILGVTSIVYICELIYGVTILVHSDKLTSPYTILTLMLFLFGSALSRAWQLTGIHKNDSN